jgi:hypothetical protein
LKANRFPKKVVSAIREGKILGIRAGTKPHRIIGIWAVVVENRVFVRSWGLKERGRYDDGTGNGDQGKKGNG